MSTDQLFSFNLWQFLLSHLDDATIDGAMAFKNIFAICSDELSAVSVVARDFDTTLIKTSTKMAGFDDKFKEKCLQVCSNRQVENCFHTLPQVLQTNLKTMQQSLIDIFCAPPPIQLPKHVCKVEHVLHDGTNLLETTALNIIFERDKLTHSPAKKKNRKNKRRYLRAFNPKLIIRCDSSGKLHLYNPVGVSFLISSIFKIKNK